MHSLADSPQEIADRWKSAVVLKRDVFSTVERGHFALPSGEVDAVLRRIDAVPWWLSVVARHLLQREACALKAAESSGVAPELLHSGRQALVRRFIEGVPLHLARPIGDARFFRSARAALQKLHRAGICHNDLGKEQNWLRAPDGRAYLTDFQLSMQFRGRGKLFRIAAYEDLRHLLKHKRSYVPDALTAAERRVLSRKSWLTRIWMSTGKKIYLGVTRGLFRFVDREGGGTRLVRDAPEISMKLKSIPNVRDASVVAFADRRAGTGLYAFVETDSSLSERDLREGIIAIIGRVRAPERIQIVDALPRRPTGEIHQEILHLVAMNQLDLIDPLIGDDRERAIIDRVISGRRNLQDRFTF